MSDHERLAARIVRLTELERSSIHASKFRSIGRGWAKAFVDDFVRQHGHLDTGEWNTRVNRLWLDEPDKTRAHRDAWAILSELGALPRNV